MFSFQMLKQVSRAATAYENRFQTQFTKWCCLAFIIFGKTIPVPNTVGLPEVVVPFLGRSPSFSPSVSLAMFVCACDDGGRDTHCRKCAMVGKSPSVLANVKMKCVRCALGNINCIGTVDNKKPTKQTKTV